MAQNPSSVWGFASMDPGFGFNGYETEIEAYRDRGDDRVCGVVQEWVRADVAYDRGRRMAEDAVKEERGRIAALLENLDRVNTGNRTDDPVILAEDVAALVAYLRSDK